jgi:DNA-binding CsgD family transcriptional regulator
MSRLTHRQYARLLTFLQDLYIIRNQTEFISHVLQSLHAIIKCDLISYTEIDFKNESVMYNWGPDNPTLRESLRPALERTGYQHPAVPYLLKTNGEQSVQISDFVSQRVYKKLDIYQDFFRHVDTNYQVATLITVSPSFMVPVCFNRKHRDFSKDDRAQLDLLRLHLVQASGNAQGITHMQNQLNILNQTMEVSHQALISVTDSGRIRFMTPHAMRLLTRYGVSTHKTGDWLPTRLRDWLGHELARLASPTLVPIPPQPLHIQGAEGILKIHFLQKDSHLLLLINEQFTRLSVADFAQFGLSRRETEILRWVAQGKTNPEIGTILSISPRTVQKHLERVYNRLGVENRHAAMRMALDANFRQEGTSKSEV